MRAFPAKSGLRFRGNFRPFSLSEPASEVILGRFKNLGWNNTLLFVVKPPSIIRKSAKFKGGIYYNLTPNRAPQIFLS